MQLISIYKLFFDIYTILLLLNVNILLGLGHYVLFQLKLRGVISFFNFSDRGSKALFGTDVEIILSCQPTSLHK